MGGGWERGRLLRGRDKVAFWRAKPTDLLRGAVHAHEVYTHEVYDHEVHAHKVHTHEVHAHEVYT
jgi:hypothetical protein